MSDIGPFGFVRGLNTRASATTLPEDSLSDAQNVNVLYGDLVKRRGSRTINTTAISGTPVVHGLADWQTAAGQRYLVVTAGTTIQQTADLGTTLTNITGTATITAGANNQHTFASLNNLLIICGGTTPDTPLQWSGTGNVASLAGSPPVGNICCVANNFAFISGNTVNPSRVWWSNVIDPGTWGTSNYVDFRISDGDRVMALCELNQNLIIFKRRSIGQLWTIPPSTAASVTLAPLTEIVVGIGCVGSQAVDKLPDGRIVFMANNAHVYIFDGANLTDISDPEPPMGSIQPTLDGLNVSRLPYAVVRAYPTRNEIWISVSNTTSTTHNLILVYNTMLKAWESRFTGIAANVMTTSIDTRSSPSRNIIMLTGNYAGRVYEQDYSNNNAEDTNNLIDGYGTVSIQLKPDATGFIPRSAMMIYESQGNYNLEVNYGFNGFTEIANSIQISQFAGGGLLDSFTLGTSTLGGVSTLRKNVLLLSNGRTSSIQIQFRNRQAAQDFSVHPFHLSDEVMI